VKFKKERGGDIMKRFSTVALAVTASLALAGAAFAQMGGPGHMGGPGRMGGGGMGPGMMGGAGQFGCPGAAGYAQQQGAAQITEEQATALAQQYADQYLKGFKVEKVLPFAGRRGAMYQVELQGPDGQMRTLHVNPWGNVMPFGGPSRRAG
jgi:hypothetical protein